MSVKPEEAQTASWRVTIVFTALALTACSSSSSTSTATTATPVGTNTNWVKDSTNALNVFLPDEDSVYWFEGDGTANGARTILSGQVGVIT